MSIPSTILVTGSNGFIGQHLCRYFTDLNYRVIACARTEDPQHPIKASKKYFLNLPNPQFDELIAEQKPEFLLHCAGGASVGDSFNHPEKDFTNNVLLTQFILESLKQHSPSTKFIFFSSAAVYGDTSNLIIDGNTPLKPISPYGYHKLICELNCEKFHKLFNLPITILRIFSVYGPGLRKQILWDLYQKALASKTIQLHGTGDELRDFLYIDDLLKNVSTLLKTSPFTANKVNLATGHSIRIENLATRFLKKMDKSFSLKFSGIKKPGDPDSWNIDSSALAFPSMQWTSLDVGIENYLNWIIQENSI